MYTKPPSLAQRMLVQMAIRIGIVILIAMGLGYWHSFRAHERDALSFLSKYAKARGEAESELFVQAERNSRRMRDEFVRRLDNLGETDVSREFDRLIAQDPDGIFRIRRKYSDHAHKASLAILPTADFNPTFKREVLTAYAIASEYGPAYRDRYYDTFFPLHGNDVVVIYLPDTDYSRTGGSDMLLVDYASEVGSSPQKNPERRTYWTDVYYDEVVKQWMVSVASPIDYRGQWIGGAGHDVPIQQLIERTNSVHIPGTFNLIVTRQGQLVAHKHWSRAIAEAGGEFDIAKADNRELLSIYVAAKSTSPDQNVVSTADGAMILSVSEIQGPDWLFITVYPKALLAAHARDTASVLLVIGLASLLLEVLILGWVLRVHVTKPLRQFLTTMQALKRGSAGLELDASHTDEIGQIAQVFAHMAHAVQINQENLEEQVRERTTQLQALFDANPLAIAKVAERQIVAVNKATINLLGYSEEQLLGQSIRVFFPNEQAFQHCLDLARPELEAGEIFHLELPLLAYDGRQFWASVHGKAMDPDHIRKGGTLWIFEDITARREGEEKIRHMAQHDALTGLANRALLYDLLGQLLSMAHRQKKWMAVLFLDLDNFKPVNDRYGHEAGDAVLREIAQRLKTCVRETDAVGRVGGDEFIVLLFDIHDNLDVARIADTIVKQLSMPVHIHGHEVHLSTSIGISLYPKDGENADALINKADVAMYTAKDGGKNRYCFFENRSHGSSVDA